MYLTMRVKVGGMTDHPIVVGVVLATDHRQAQGQCFVVGHGCSITFDGRHGSMKPEGRRTIMGGCDAPSMRAKYKTAQTMMIAVTIKPLPFTKAFSTVVTERGSGGHDKAGRYHSQPHTCPLASTCECLAHMYSCPYQVAVGG
jgi:hypothetical protein